jgi:hypothetical protein
MFYDEFDVEEGIIAQDDALEQMLLDEEPTMAYGSGDFKIDQGKFCRAFPATAMVPNPTTRPAPKALTNDDVLSLKEAGFSDELIIAKIESAPGDYKLDTRDMVALKRAGVSDAVITALVSAQSGK